jgi:hypothetical protein
MSADAGDDARRPSGLNRGQSLVARYREERLKQRPALQTDLRNERMALRQSRLIRLAQSEPNTGTNAPAEGVSPPAGAAPARDGQSPRPGPSVFAQFVDHALDHALDHVLEQAIHTGTQTEPRDEPVPAEAQSPANPPQPAAIQPEPPPQPPATPPSLAAIGFGPGMVIRFRQLGVETAADLATADPNSLREALGDISRLINVEFWIESARSACAEKAA